MCDEISPNKPIKHIHVNKAETDTQKMKIVFYAECSSPVSHHKYSRIVFFGASQHLHEIQAGFNSRYFIPSLKLQPMSV